MTTKPVLRQFVFNKIPYYTDGGECYDLGSEGDFGHYAALNFELFYDKAGTKPVPIEEWPDEEDFYEKAANTSEALLMRHGRWGFDQHGWEEGIT